MDPHPTTCLHVGLPKTATTTLQLHLFPRHPDVHYLGKWPTGAPYPDPRVRRMVRPLRKGVATPEEIERFRRDLRDIRAEAPSHRVAVLSAESLAKGPRDRRRRRARQYREVFGGGMVLITIRRPASLVESLYLQRAGHEVLAARHRYHRVKFRTVGEWLEEKFESVEHGTLTPLDYACTVRLFAREFGYRNVGVFLLEELAEDPDGYYRRLCSFLGIEEARAGALLGRRKANVRVSRATLDRIRKVAGSPVKSRLVGLLSASMRQRYFGAKNGAALRGERARAEISPAWRRRIDDFTRAGNRELSRDWNLPLERYGYPV